ncbi:MAG TPA: site-specific DNA-methyltransferase [Ilumatobacteraceae bacterium]|nr:site-specific DNA-methyltransferase [Ilumatobacteraceae bacterium]
MAARPTKSVKRDVVIPVEDYEHSAAKRTNNPPAGLTHLDREETPTRTLQYDPHLDPQLQWAGKAERTTVDVPAPSIHVHEELSAQKIIGSVRRQRMQQPLFDLAQLDPAKAVEFYQHEMNWSNRMILGDSLVVMSSLLERERLGGQVQCVFMDPPYGIKYQSNFQPTIGSRQVTDGKDEDLTREPEMIQAYRDTWELEVHSYLSYLRDRFFVARELLSDSGSIFIQIGEENVHLVRVLLDEVFGAQNFVSQVAFATTSGAGSPGELKNLPATCNYLVWYSKQRYQLKYRQLYISKTDTRSADAKYTYVELPDGTRRAMTKGERTDPSTMLPGSRVYRLDNLTSQSGVDKTRYPVAIDGVEYRPGKGVWKTSEEGMRALLAANRVVVTGNTLSYVRFLDDFTGSPITNLWEDVSSGLVTDKRYVVQTNPKVIARCILMTTDPGDLVIDPTCGSGTTAYVAEQYGRRWITMDTSRVAMSIARERLLTATFPYYKLRDASRDVDGGFTFETLQRITLGSIARGQQSEDVVLVDRPLVDRKKTRVSGPFTVEALSRYAVNPSDEAPSAVPAEEDASGHVETLLEALIVQGIPRPGKTPAKIESLSALAAAGALQAEGVVDLDGRKAKFAVSLGPRFGAVTMGQVSDALQEAIGFQLVVLAGFAVSADAQERLATGKVGSTEVALLMANPDLLVGNLLKNTKASQTFRLYSSPDVRLTKGKDGYRLHVEGMDTFDATTGEVTSVGRTGIQAWFLDDEFDGRVFRASQAFFPVSEGWTKLSKALQGTVDAELVEELHSWTSLPFDGGDKGRVAARVIANDGNAAEIIVELSSAVPEDSA